MQTHVSIYIYISPVGFASVICPPSRDFHGDLDGVPAGTRAALPARASTGSPLGLGHLSPAAACLCTTPTLQHLLSFRAANISLMMRKTKFTHIELITCLSRVLERGLRARHGDWETPNTGIDGGSSCAALRWLSALSLKSQQKQALESCWSCS